MDLENRGIPGGYILSEEFRQANDTQAQALGFSPYTVVVEHPIQDRTDAEMATIADNCFEQVKAMLVSAREAAAS
jgi:hypothetical protein